MSLKTAVICDSYLQYVDKRKSRMKNISIMIILSVSVISFTAHSQVYKSDDEEGNIKYGDRPKGEQSKKLPVQTQPGSSSSKEQGSSAGKTPHQLNQEFLEERKRLEQERREQKKAGIVEEGKQLCRKAQEDEERLKKELIQLEKDHAKRGSAKMAETINQKNRELKHARQDKVRYCDYRD